MPRKRRKGLHRLDHDPSESNRRRPSDLLSDGREISESRELVEAFETNRKLGKWAFRFKGQMVDVPNLKRAQAILARAEVKAELDRKWSCG